MRRPILLLSIIGVVLLTILWWFFFISPKRTEISDLQSQTEAAQAEEQNLRAQKARLLEIQENELTFITATAQLEKSVPATPELAGFIDDVNLLAAETGVVLLSLNPGLPSPEALGRYQEITVSVEIDGQYFEILGFLYGLADLERLVRVDSLSLSPAASEGPDALSASIEAKIFTTAGVTPAEVPVPPPEEPPTDGTTTTTIAGETTTTIAGETTTTIAGETTTTIAGETTTTTTGGG